MISVVVPLYNEGSGGREAARRLLAEKEWGEIILAEAGDDEASRRLLDMLVRESAADGRLRIVSCPQTGRARQLNRGAAAAVGEELLFLHADTILPDGAPTMIDNALADGARWGRFDVRLAAEGKVYRLIESMMNLRSRITGIATGDQALFMPRPVFNRLGGYANIALMEDIEISRRLKRFGRPAVIPARAITSARRWQQDGVVRTTLLMWRLRFLYWLGTDPEKLAGWYRDAR
ncbi:MAG: TIGR04283 family arsenosugar biosynthesis glycosyltransferase [Pseudomonadota bacterium]|nr:TIGR04283 family arsenosugar biosynthesis glycosyltransferase [Pseudomonadota bacterium]